MRRVLVIRSNQLLAVGVESLILQKNNMIVMSAAFDDVQAIRTEIESFHPDVLILDDSLKILDLPALFGLIKEFANLRVVVVNVEANELHVYERHVVSVKPSNEFIAVIQ